MACSSDCAVSSACLTGLGMSASAALEASQLAVTAAQAETLQRLADVLWSAPASTSEGISFTPHDARVSIDMGSLAHGTRSQHFRGNPWPAESSQQGFDGMFNCRSSLSAADLSTACQTSTSSPFTFEASLTMRPPTQRVSLDYSAVSSLTGAFSGPLASDSLGIPSSFDINTLGSYANSSYPSSLAGSATDGSAPLDASTMALLTMQHQQQTQELLNTRAQVQELQQQLETLQALAVVPQGAAAAAAPVAGSR